MPLHFYGSRCTIADRTGMLGIHKGAEWPGRKSSCDLPGREIVLSIHLTQRSPKRS